MSCSSAAGVPGARGCNEPEFTRPDVTLIITTAFIAVFDVFSVVCWLWCKPLKTASVQKIASSIAGIEACVPVSSRKSVAVGIDPVSE